MSVVAWDGKTLAADQQIVTCDTRSRGTKLFKYEGGAVAFTGGVPAMMALLDWL